jgi:hypothetical protein
VLYRLIIPLLCISISCAGARIAAPVPRGTLRFSGEPRDAHIEIDEKSIGPMNMFETMGLLLKPGPHRIIVRADGYFPEYRIVNIEENTVQVAEIFLRPIPE